MPLTYTTKNPTGADEVPAEQSSQGGGSSPGWWMTPAEAEAASAHTNSAQGSKSLLTADSPISEVVAGRGSFATKTAHTTTEDPADLARFRTLASADDFDSLTALCRERLLTAPDLQTSLRWQKDFSIVKSLQGKYSEALDLLVGAHREAQEVGGTLRGKYENEFAIVLVEFNRPLLAFDHFDLAREFHRADPKACAEVDNNAGRAYAAQGETVKAAACFRRALDYARANNDYRLEREVCDTLIEFGGAE